jgi:elongation factor G
MDLARLRNFGVAAHIDAGKTTVSEGMLLHGGVERRAGRVDEGTSVMDWMAEERERGITITAAATRLPWRGHELNLIDTPGHVDFTVEVERCMRVLDGAVLVIDGVVGVQAQSETVWRQMERHGVPAIAFVNKCDRPGADFLGAMATLERRLGARPVAIGLPVLEEGGGVRCLVDLLERRALAPGRGGQAVEVPVPAEVEDEVELLRLELAEALAEEDEELLGLVLEGGEAPAATLRRALREAVLARRLLPVLAGAALRDIGVEALLDAVVDYLPSPLEAPPARAVRIGSGEERLLTADPAATPCALAFKLHAGPHGDLVFVRLYSGSLAPGQVLLNPRTGRRERIARVLRIHADSHEDLERAEAGDLVGLTGLLATGTGDTLCDPEDPMTLEGLEFPEPVLTLALEPESGEDRDRLREALGRLVHEDPTFRAREDDSGQWVVGGMGELHLEIAGHRLRDEFGLQLRAGQPRVAYREALTAPGRATAEVDRGLAGREAHARVSLEVVPEPGAPAPRVEFAPSCALPEGVREAVTRALVLEAQVGPRFGFPLSGAAIRVLEAEAREGREGEGAWVQAAVAALRQAMPEGAVTLQEPLMAFEIQCPAEFSSGIIADLNARRAQLAEVLSEGDLRTLRGQVPLAEMVGYATAVRSLSQGRASFSMRPSGTRAVPEAELAGRGLTWA